MGCSRPSHRPAGADRAATRRNLVGAIVKMREIEDAYLYTIRLVDPEVIKARQIVTANTNEYRGLEGEPHDDADRLRAALSRADADHRAVGDLDRHCRRRPAGPADPAADRRGRRGRDRQSRRHRPGARAPTATSPRSATPSTRCCSELKSQRDEILQAKDLIDERRRFSEAVLAGVTAGVIGVDSDGTITIVNRSAESMLATSTARAVARPQPVGDAAACRPRLRDRPQFRPRRSTASR